MNELTWVRTEKEYQEIWWRLPIAGISLEEYAGSNRRPIHFDTELRQRPPILNRSFRCQRICLEAFSSLCFTFESFQEKPRKDKDVSPKGALDWGQVGVNKKTSFWDTWAVSKVSRSLFQNKICNNQMVPRPNFTKHSQGLETEFSKNRIAIVLSITFGCLLCV